MGLIKFVKGLFQRIKRILNDNTFDNLLLLVDTIPTIFGFSIRADKVKAPFWIIHLFLMLYIYTIGNLVYQIWYADGPEDFIKSYVNVSILILTLNNSYWFLTKRGQLKLLIKKGKLNDDLAVRSPLFQEKHANSLKIIKRMLLIFYGMNHFNAYTNYIPHRTKLNNEFSMVPCFGLDLTTSPTREMCSALLITQEITIMTVVLNYQCMLVFLFAHTATTYHRLADEIMTFNSEEVNVKEQLPFIVNRHVLILDIIDTLKNLYSVPIGVNFASNAVCIAFFFYLPLQEWIRFLPILMYCFLVFFLYCFLGQKVVDGAESFARAVYSCGWESFGLREKKMVYITLMLSQRKVEVLAADIIPVNIYTFATTLQAMFKFVTVVKF